MNKSEHQALLDFYEKRAAWLRKEIAQNQQAQARFLTKADPSDINAEKAHNNMVYINLIRFKEEKLVLDKEIKRMKKKLGIEEG